MKTKKTLRDFKNPTGLLRSQATFLTDGIHFAIPSLEGTIHVFNITTGKKIGNLAPRVGGIDEFDWSPDHQFVLIQSSDQWRLRKIFHVASGRIWSEFHCTQYRPAWSLDSRNVALPEEKKIVVREIATGRVRLAIALEKNQVCCLGFSPDGRLLAAGLDDSTALVFNLAQAVSFKE